MKAFIKQHVFKGRSPRRELQDARTCLSFAVDPRVRAPLSTRLTIIKRVYEISAAIPCFHTQTEALSVIRSILALPDSVRGVIVEAGCFKGGSTAKFSLAAARMKRDLVVFDSFEGLPVHNQPVTVGIHGLALAYKPGDYCGALEEVTANVRREGEIEPCKFIPGWFDDTMPKFKTPIAVIYIDCDLDSSTKTCLKYLYPLLSSGGVLYSQDGHIRPVIDVFADESFWRNEVGCAPPEVQGLGSSKLLKIVKA